MPLDESCYRAISISDTGKLIKEFESKIKGTGASIVWLKQSIFDYADMYIKLLRNNEKNNDMNKLLCSDEYYNKIFCEIRNLSELIM